MPESSSCIPTSSGRCTALSANPRASQSIRYRACMPEIYGFHNGLNLDDLDVTSDDEINTFLTSARIGGHESVYGQRIIRGPLDPGPRYDMTANSIWLYTRPDCAKL